MTTRMASLLAAVVLVVGARVVDGQLWSAPTPQRALTLVHGRLVTVDDGPVGGMRAWIDWGRSVDTIVFDSLGRFATLPEPFAADSITLVVQPTDSGRYYPVRARLAVDRIAHTLDVLLVPRVWRIDGGRFAGVEIPIDVDAVLRRGSDRGSFGRVKGKQLVGWTDGSFPVPVVLRHDAGLPISAADSAAFWSAVRAVEQSLGGPFFLPAGDTLLRGTIYPIDVRIDPRIDADAKTWVSWNRDGQIFEGVISFRTHAQLRSEAVVAHELLHVLGFGHTAAWPSTLSPRLISGGGVTATDVAYAQLLLRAQALERRRAMVGGFTASSPSREAGPR